VLLALKDAGSELFLIMQFRLDFVGYIAEEESAKMGVAEWIIIMVIIWAFWFCRRKTS